MSRTPMFLTAVTTHLSTMRDIVRLQGMLVAEEVSKKSLNSEGPVKPLDFGDIWEAEGPSYDSIRELKAWLCEAAEDIKVVDWMLDDTEVGQVEEVDDFKPAVGAFHTLDAPTTQTKISESAIPSAPKPGGKGLIQVIDSTSEFDDYEEVDEPDLQPYALPPKPAAEDLKDIDDLSAYTPAKKKAKPPVYIPDLCAYLRSDNADKLAVGLKEAASLIRRKAQWGTELSEADSSPEEREASLDLY